MLGYISNILKHEVMAEVRKLDIEKMYGFYLKKRSEKPGDYTVCGFMELGSGDARSVSPDTISYKTMKKIYFDLEADALVILHNHPKLKNRNPSSVSPSEDDIIGTYAVARICLSNKMNLIDHIIVDTDNYFSFVENQLIDLN